ncbi:piggyBac transposable element-derived protein 3-like [Anthonomus grandis grandis]|uniref:piggyBac transposable element-derived protein 3-like n=1 Tax=Anthonomus grandis grandis TaxID=2921223 RepID=UPI0021658737|nr:piggyBac transposable element-derived protein 3-like [Anthonomus grandis grandis]
MTLFLAIFGNDPYLRPGKDDDRLLQLLNADDSEFEGDSDDDEDGIINAETIGETIIEEEDLEETLETMDIIEDQIDENQDDYDGDSDPEFDIPLSILKEKMSAKAKRMTWRKSDSFKGVEVVKDGFEESHFQRAGWKIMDYVSVFIDDKLFETMRDCTNINFFLENDKIMNLSTDEVKKIIGISVLMSCLKYPRVKMFWAKTTRVDSIAKHMTRDRFFSIRSHLKVVIDNDVLANDRQKDRLWKVRPITERVRQGCLKLERQENVAVDEQIPFTGTCGLKQFVRGKPNPEGLKNFVCAIPEGLVLDFEIYQGKQTFLDEN